MNVWVADRWELADGTKSAASGNGSRWQTKWLDPVTGKERSKSFKKQADAKAYRTKMEDSLRAQTYIDPKHAVLTFQEVSERFRAQHHTKIGTKSTEDREFRSYVLPKWGAWKLGDMKRTDIEDWVQELSAGTAPVTYAGKANNRVQRPLAPNTVKHYLQHVTAVLRYAMDRDMIVKNPASRTSLPKAPDRDQLFLNIEQVEDLASLAYNVARRDADRALIYLLAYGGLRIGEALALQVGDLDLENRRASISRTWVDNAGTAVLDTTKTSKGFGHAADGN